MLPTWLARIPIIQGRVLPSLDAVPWSSTDCLWIHGTRHSHPSLRSWLQAGGRLLATLDAGTIPAALGLEPTPPDEVVDGVWPTDPDPAPLGLAGYGHHPLFEGLPQGAHVWQPVAGEGYRLAVYASGAPVQGRVVAVERRGGAVDARRVVAWEHEVGRGGILCIGIGAPLRVHQGHLAEQYRILLENALARDGIPAGARRSGVSFWPAPAQRVVRRDLAPVPSLPWLPGGGAPEMEPPLRIASPPHARHEWRLTGRRGVLSGNPADGLREACLHPFRVASDLSLKVNGVAPATEALEESPVCVRRHSRAGAATVSERWSAALEHPVLWWEVRADPSSPIRLEWTCDLRRGPPYPSGAAGDLDLTVSPDGRRAAVAAIGDPFRVLVEVEGGTMEASSLAPAAIRFTLRATGHALVRLTAASDPADWDRTAHLLERRGAAALEAQRADHARELSTYATSVETPEPELGASLEWAKLRMDGALAGAPGVGRCAVADGHPNAFVATSAIRTALAQLAAGDRGGPRDVLKFLSLTSTADGRLLRDCSTGGLGTVDATESIPDYLLLAARYAAWTGDLDFLSHRWSAVRRALEAGVAEGAHQGPNRARWREALGALQPLAEALGHPEVAEALVAHAGSLPPDPPGTYAAEWRWADPADPVAGSGALDAWRRLAPGLVQGSTERPVEDGAALVRAAVLGVWGVRPNALEGGVRVAPWFPVEWESMSLDRLRVGKSVLRVHLRRRFGQVAARVERKHGPRMHVEFVLRGAPPGDTVLLDDVELHGPRVAFEAEASHALVWPG